MRILVVKRKGVAPDAGTDEEEPKGAETKSEAEEEADEGEPMEEVTCPNCKCRIDTVTGKEIVGKDEDDVKHEGAELDESDSTYAKPGPFGTASDAARGTEAQAKLLGSLRK